MNRQEIINEIKRTAVANGGRPPGRAAFEKATGIKASDWYGKYWARWNDAVVEAGFETRKLNPAYEREFVIGKFISLIRELGHFPVTGEIRLKAKNDTDFPHHNTFDNHLGTKSERAQNVIAYCREKGGSDDVIAICEAHANTSDNIESVAEVAPEQIGYVYLVKSGKHYKIGRTNAVDRRQYEIGLQLPSALVHIHSIETDDPSGIEAYRHNRFRVKRLNGEWFNLSADDVRKFRRRKFM